MKGSNSRLNFDAARRYSNVYQVQGGMITDSDLGEAADIALSRDEAQGRAFAASGVPVEGGMIAWQDDAPGVTEGTVFAEGKQGHFRLSEPVDPADIPSAVGKQTDYPEAPKLTEEPALLYVDVWERPVFAAQDSGMTDAGLHGIETGYRTQTMVQLKALKIDDGSEESIAKVMAGHPAFLRHGTARAKLAAIEPDVAVDACDPCANLIEIDQTVPNALFRLEVVRVERIGGDKVTGLALAWSMENAAATERNSEETRGALKKDGAVYQFFSDATEMHQGWFPSGVTPLRGAFTDNLDAAPLEGDPNGFAYLRRWDGHVIVDVAGAALGDRLGPAQPRIEGKTVVIPTAFFTLSLPLEDADYLVGDYWLVELRRYADEPQRVQLVGAEEGSAAPHGIAHRFCPLMLIKNGKAAEKQPDWLRRATSFPALSDLPADHVSYDTSEDCPVFKGAETVQEALDALCDLNAKDVHFDPDPGCDTLAETGNVHDALMSLCKADDDHTLRLMLRTMADWGVVCGLRLTLTDAQTLRVTPGTVLNRLGDLRSLPKLAIDLRKIPPEQIHGDLEEIMEKHGEVCLSLELTDDEPLWHLSDPEFPFTTDDLTMRERIEACLSQRRTLDTGKVLESLKDDQRVVLNKVHVAWTNRDVLATTMALDRKQMDIAQDIFDRLAAEFMDFASESGKASLEVLLERAKQEFGRSIGLSGTAEEQRQMQFMVAQFGILALVEMEDKKACQCDNALPVCPEDEPRIALVPVACVELFRFDPGERAADSVCDFCCRKVSRNWRRERYYNGDPLEDQLKEFGDYCCNERSFPNTEAALDAYSPTAEMLSAAVGSPFWPPDPGVTNLADRSGPDVRGLTISKATEVMKGAGVGVDDKSHIDLDEGDIFDRLVQIRDQDPTQVMVLDYQAKQGDTVAFFTSRGVVRDIFVTRQAFWKGFLDFGALLEVATADLKLKGEVAVRDPDPDSPWLVALTERIGKLEAEPVDPRIKAVEDLVATLREEVKTATPGPAFEARLKALEQDGDRVKMADFQALEDKVSGLGDSDTTALKAEMEDLRKRNDALIAANREAAGTIEGLTDTVKTMEAAVLRAAPVEDVVTKTAAKSLRDAGVTTKGQLDSLSRTELERVLRSSRTGVDSVLTASRNFKL